MKMPNGTLLMRLQTDRDVAVAMEKWPVIRPLPPMFGDELWRVKPVLQVMPESFVVTRDGQEIFGCSMVEAESKTQK